MMKRFLLFSTVLLSAWVAFGEGPQYTHKDPTVNKEFINAYQDIRTKIPNYSTSTFAILGGTQSLTGITAIKGTTTNDSASSGYVGEYVSSATLARANTAVSNHYSDVASIILSAGDWDISANASWFNNGATWSYAFNAISTTSGDAITGADYFNSAAFLFANSSTAIESLNNVIPNYRVSISAQTTYYLKAYQTYSAGGPPQVGGSIYARRAR